VVGVIWYGAAQVERSARLERSAACRSRL